MAIIITRHCGFQQHRGIEPNGQNQQRCWALVEHPLFRWRENIRVYICNILQPTCLRGWWIRALYWRQRQTETSGIKISRDPLLNDGDAAQASCPWAHFICTVFILQHALLSIAIWAWLLVQLCSRQVFCPEGLWSHPPKGGKRPRSWFSVRGRTMRGGLCSLGWCAALSWQQRRGRRHVCRMRSQPHRHPVWNQQVRCLPRSE